MKKKEKSNDALNLAIVLAIIILISFSIGIFVKRISSPKIEKEYSNGFTFTKSGNFWVTVVLNSKTKVLYPEEFRYSPSEVKDIKVEGNPKTFLDKLIIGGGDSIYFTFDPSKNTSLMNIIALDTSKMLNELNQITLVAACTKNETEACSDRPIVTCENQIGKALVIYVKPSNLSKLSTDNNCLTIEGSGKELLKTYTKLLFLWYGII